MNTLKISRLSGLVTVWFMLLAADPALAQAGGVGGSAGGGMGIGGSGGGPGSPPMVSTSKSAPSSWGGRGSLLNLIADPGIQRELGLTPAQKGQADAIVAGVRQAAHQQDKASFARGRDRIELLRKRDERIAAMRRDAAVMEQEIEAVLNPEQRRILARARQQDRAGVGAVRAPGLAGTQARGTAGVSVPTSLPGVAVVQTNAASGGGGYASGGDPGSVQRVIRSPAVVQSLALTPQQFGAIEAVMVRLHAREQQLASEMAALSPMALSRQQRTSAKGDIASLARTATQTLEAMLNPAQQARVKQISLQALGAGALFRPEVIDALKLTATQQARLASVSQATQKQVDAIFMPAPLGPAADPAAPVPQAMRPPKPLTHGDFDRAQQIQQRGGQAMLAVLTPAQRQAFQTLQGRPYPGLDQIAGFGGGGSSSSGSGYGTSP